jgi:hypothetical protein
VRVFPLLFDDDDDDGAHFSLFLFPRLFLRYASLSLKHGEPSLFFLALSDDTGARTLFSLRLTQEQERRNRRRLWKRQRIRCLSRRRRRRRRRFGAMRARIPIRSSFFSPFSRLSAPLTLPPAHGSLRVICARHIRHSPRPLSHSKTNPTSKPPTAAPSPRPAARRPSALPGQLEEAPPARAACPRSRSRRFGARDCDWLAEKERSESERKRGRERGREGANA